MGCSIALAHLWLLVAWMSHLYGEKPALVKNKLAKALHKTAQP